MCVVELASLIGGEEFGDHPRCVCEVIAAFLRSWNDRLSHADRQRLLPYAERVVGTRAGRAVTRLRRDVCLSWAGADLSGGPLSRLSARLRARLRIAALLGGGAALDLRQGSGEYAARLAFARYDARAAFALLDELLAIGTEEQPPSRSATAIATDAMRKALPEGTVRTPPGNGHRPSSQFDLSEILAAVSSNGDAAQNGARANGAPHSRRPVRR